MTFSEPYVGCHEPLVGLPANCGTGTRLLSNPNIQHTSGSNKNIKVFIEAIQCLQLYT